MKKMIRISESQVKTILNHIINEESEMGEAGTKGQWKSEWNMEDQMLAMYNSLYGIEELGVTKAEVAHDIIGSSIGSFMKQTSNFDFLSGKNGLSRPHKLQSPVYDKFKGLSRQDFKNICLDIIEKRLSNPEESVVRKKVGKEIGVKRDDITQSREDALRKMGVDPKKAKLISTRPKESPTDDDNETNNDGVNTTSIEKEPMTRKKEVQDYLVHIYSELNRLGLLSLADEVEEINNYIGDKLTDKNTISELYRIVKTPNVASEHIKSIKKVINENKKMKRTIRLTETEFNQVIKNIISENDIDMDEHDHNEDFGNVTIQINGDGFIKRAVVSRIRGIFKHLQGDRHLFIDGEEVSSYQENNHSW